MSWGDWFHTNKWPAQEFEAVPEDVEIHNAGRPYPTDVDGGRSYDGSSQFETV